MKKALVIRYGAIGDAVIMSPIFRLLKEDGYHITLNTIKRCWEVIKGNPYIDTVLYHDENMPADETLTKHWEELSKGYDKVVNLTESIEGSLSPAKKNDLFYASKEERFSKCNVNFYDRTLEIAGYDTKGLNGEIYHTNEEERWGQKVRDKFKGKFLILWALSGSSIHKTYPYTEHVIDFITAFNPQIQVITVGDDLCKLLEWDHRPHRGVLFQAGELPIRKSMVLAKYADMVVGTDTGMMHVAGCYETPKLLMLSSNTAENLSKYWKNCATLSANVKCRPCFRLIYPEDAEKVCVLGKSGGTICMERIHPQAVIDGVLKIYNEWKELNGILCRDRRETIVC